MFDKKDKNQLTNKMIIKLFKNLNILNDQVLYARYPFNTFPYILSFKLLIIFGYEIIVIKTAFFEHK